MNEELKQSLDIDYMELLYEDETVSIVNLWVMHEGLNRNRCNIPHDVIINALPSLANRPIWGIPNTILKDYSDDFIEHARNSEQEKDILIFGVFPESGVKNFEFIDFKGKTYLKVQAILFKKYSPIAMNIIKRRDGNCKISIEILVKGNTIDGILNVKEMVFLSACCLGKDIKEGIENSNLQVVRFSLDEAIQESNKKYLIFAEKEQTYPIPQEVKDNVQKGLNFKKEYGRGGTATGIKTAKYITDNQNINYSNIEKINNFFSKHSEDNIDETNINNEYITWLIWGGNEARDWVDKIIKDNSSLQEATDTTVKNSVVDIDNIQKLNNKEDESMDDNKIIEFSLNSTQIFEIFANAINSIKYMNGDWECCKYWTEAYDENFVYLRDCEEGKTYKMPYTLQDNVATIDFENKVLVASGGYLEVGENGETITNDNPTEEMEEMMNKYKELETKYSELEVKNSDTESKLKMAEDKVAEFAKKEEEVKMMSLLEQFSHCMSDEEKTEMASKVSEIKFADFENMINEKVKKFALESKENKKEDDTTEVKNSFGVSISNFGLNDHYDYQNKDNADISLAEKYGVKIK